MGGVTVENRRSWDRLKTGLAPGPIIRKRLNFGAREGACPVLRRSLKVCICNQMGSPVSAHQHQPPRSPDTYGRHSADAEGRWRRIAASPFFIVSVVVAGFLLLGVLLVIAAQFQSALPLVVPGALRATMPDGSYLWLKVTSGNQHNFEFEYPEPDAVARIFDPTNSRTVNAHTMDNRFVVWLMRQDPVTGRPLDLDWWSHASVVDEHGRVLLDSNAQRSAYHTYGSRSEGGARPFSPLEPQQYVGIVGQSELPLFRHSGQTFTLRVHNTDGEIVARFAVPYKLPFEPPNWKPDELPATKSRGELAVTLREVVFEEQEYRVNDRTERAIRIQPQLDVTYRGEPTDVWRITHTRISDPLGNSDSLWRCRLLDRHEAAWKLLVRAQRTPAAEFAADEMWHAGPLQIPEANKQQAIAQQHSLQGTGIRLVGIGGTGRTTHHRTDPEQRSGGGSSSGSLQTADRQRVNYEIDVDYRNGAKTISVDAPLPYVVIEVTGREADQSLLVRGLSNSGEEVPTHMNTTIGDLHFVFLEVPSSEKQVELTFVVHRTHEFEFFIEPPAEESSREDD